jgi:hypothetical protein
MAARVSACRSIPARGHPFATILVTISFAERSQAAIECYPEQELGMIAHGRKNIFSSGWGNGQKSIGAAQNAV